MYTVQNMIIRNTSFSFRIGPGRGFINNKNLHELQKSSELPFWIPESPHF